MKLDKIYHLTFARSIATENIFNYF